MTGAISALLCCPFKVGCLKKTTKKPCHLLQCGGEADWCVPEHHRALVNAILADDTEKISLICNQVEEEDEDTMLFALRIAITNNGPAVCKQVSVLLNRARQAPTADLFRLCCYSDQGITTPPEIFGLLVKKWVQHAANNEVDLRNFFIFLTVLLLENRYVSGERQLQLVSEIRGLTRNWRNALNTAITYKRGIGYRTYRLLIGLTDSNQLQLCLENAIYRVNLNAIKALSFCPFLRISSHARIIDRYSAIIYYRTLVYRKRGVQRFLDYVRRFIERLYQPGGKGYEKALNSFSMQNSKK